MNENRVYEGIVNTYVKLIRNMRYDPKNDGRYSGDTHTFNDDPKSPYFGFIPNDVEPVVSNLLKIHNYLYNKDKYKQYRFLDAGCGLGNILIIASVIGFEPHGIELDPKTIRLFKKLFKGLMLGITIEKSNMITYNKYGEFDVIYYYVPVRDGEIMMQATENIANGMKSGAIILPYGFSHPFREDKRFKFMKRCYGWIKK